MLVPAGRCQTLHIWECMLCEDVCLLLPDQPVRCSNAAVAREAPEVGDGRDGILAAQMVLCSHADHLRCLPHLGRGAQLSQCMLCPLLHIAYREFCGAVHVMAWAAAHICSGTCLQKRLAPQQAWLLCSVQIVADSCS